MGDAMPLREIYMYQDFCELVLPIAFCRRSLRSLRDATQTRSVSRTDATSVACNSYRVSGLATAALSCLPTQITMATPRCANKNQIYV